MHPNPLFRSEDRALLERLIARSGFGMIFLTTPDGPRVAHAPVLLNADGRIRFHLSRGNALTRHLTGSKALIVINGPDAYISARWYADPNQVPTWNYLVAEAEGTVSKLDRDDLLALLADISAQYEARISEGTPWTMDKLSDPHREGMLRAIVGFEMMVEDLRTTEKLSQNKPAEVLGPVVDGLEAQGDVEIAQLMRKLAD